MLAASCSFSWEWFSPSGIALLSHSFESIFAESYLSPSLLLITCIVAGTEDNFQSGSGLERFTHLFVNRETLILLISFKHPLYLHMLGVSCMGHGVPSARDAHPSLFVHLLLTQVPCGEGSAPHSSTLAWKIPWAEEPGRLQSMGLQRIRHEWATELMLHHLTLITSLKVLPPYLATLWDPRV